MDIATCSTAVETSWPVTLEYLRKAVEMRSSSSPCTWKCVLTSPTAWPTVARSPGAWVATALTERRISSAASPTAPALLMATLQPSSTCVKAP